MKSIGINGADIVQGYIMKDVIANGHRNIFSVQSEEGEYRDLFRNKNRRTFYNSFNVCDETDNDTQHHQRIYTHQRTGSRMKSEGNRTFSSNPKRFNFGKEVHFELPNLRVCKGLAAMHRSVDSSLNPQIKEEKRVKSGLDNYNLSLTKDKEKKVRLYSKKLSSKAEVHLSNESNQKIMDELVVKSKKIERINELGTRVKTVTDRFLRKEKIVKVNVKDQEAGEKKKRKRVSQLRNFLRSGENVERYTHSQFFFMKTSMEEVKNKRKVNNLSPVDQPDTTHSLGKDLNSNYTILNEEIRRKERFKQVNKIMDNERTRDVVEKMKREMIMESVGIDINGEDKMITNRRKRDAQERMKRLDSREIFSGGKEEVYKKGKSEWSSSTPITNLQFSNLKNRNQGLAGHMNNEYKNGNNHGSGSFICSWKGESFHDSSLVENS